MNKSDNEAKLKDFYDRLVEEHNLKGSYLLRWFNHKVENLAKAPDTVERSGITKGERLPIPKGKQALALHEFVFPKMSLREFCDFWKGVNYGSARNWRTTDEVFSELVSDYAVEFIQTFIKDYMTWAESSDLNDWAKALRMIRESRCYSEYLCNLPEALGTVIKRQMEKLGQSQGGDSLVDNLDKIRNHGVLYRIMLSYFDGTPEERRKFFEKDFKQDLQRTDEGFNKLMKYIPSAEGKFLAKNLALEVGAVMLRWNIILNEMID